MTTLYSPLGNHDPITPFMEGIGFDPGPDHEEEIPWDADNTLPFDGPELDPDENEE